MTEDEFKFLAGVLSVAVTAIVALLVSWKQSKSARELTEKNMESSMSIAKKQINATVLSGNRQAWINTLREQISELLSILSLIEAEWRIHREAAVDRSIEKRERLFHLQEKTELLINPTEPAHIALLHMIEEVVGTLVSNTTGNLGEEITRYRELIRSKSREILKAEWERVKKGE